MGPLTIDYSRLVQSTVWLIIWPAHNCLGKSGFEKVNFTFLLFFVPFFKAFKQRDETYLIIFFATYRTFILPYQVLDLLFLRYQNLSLIKTQTFTPADYAAVRSSILYVVEQWIKLHPEDWTQIKNKKCRQIVKKTLAVRAKIKYL